jgi:Ran GTPase-activating protein (RanGAP) involved in mRNA processing and transport
MELIVPALATIRLNGNNATLRELELDNVMLSSSGFRALCKALQNNRILEKLSLSENMIGTGGTGAFAELLTVNATLSVVAVDGGGCPQIAAGLATNATLRELDLRENQIDCVGITHSSSFRPMAARS